MDVIAVQSSLQEVGARWIRSSLQRASRKSVEQLLRGEIPGIIFPSFLGSATCDSIVARLAAAGMHDYEHVVAPVAKLGLVQMEAYLKGDKARYFAGVTSANLAMSGIFEGICENPLLSLVRIFNDLTGRPAAIADEGGTFGSYFAGTFRRITGPGHIHFDFGAAETRDWMISNVTAQLSWNLYMSSHATGGELVVYETQWHADLAHHQVPGEYFFEPEAVSGGRRLLYSPCRGDIVIFNSRNFHEIKAPETPRYTQSSFIGALSDGTLAFWS